MSCPKAHLGLLLDSNEKRANKTKDLPFRLKSETDQSKEKPNRLLENILAGGEGTIELGVSKSFEKGIWRELLWMNEIHFAPAEKPWFLMIPL